VAAGFVSKTAIHPCQVPHIAEAFAVTAAEVEQARAILKDEAMAVFRVGSFMCEPATHRGWAQRIMTRLDINGLKKADAKLENAMLRS